MEDCTCDKNTKRDEKRAVALPLLKFVDKNLSFQEVFTDVYDGDLDVRVKDCLKVTVTRLSV